MEDLYDSLFSSSHFFVEQLARLIFPEVPEDGPWLVLVGPERKIWTDDRSRFQRYFPDAQMLLSYCDRLADGQDPVLGSVEGGCLLGSELYTERFSVGYLFVVLPGYTRATAEANLGFMELFFSQMRLLCCLLDKNNQLHQLQLNHLSRTSKILSGHSD
jgi:hypothetical protein